MNARTPKTGLHYSPAEAKRSIIAIASLLMAGAVLTSLFQPAGGSIPGYLPLHMLVETFAVVIAILVFSAGWHAFERNLPGNIVLLGISFLGVGLLDFAHMLSYKGMPDFVTPSEPEKSIAFWLAARYLAAFAMLAASLLPPRPFPSSQTRYQLLAATLAFTLFAYWLFLFHLDAMPHTFIPGEGLTTFKIASEYVLIALYLATAFALWQRMNALEAVHTPALACAAITMAISEFFFTRYTSLTDTFNLLGHIYKIVAYLFLYRAVFLVAIEAPYRKLHASETKLQTLYNSTNDAVMLLDEKGFFDCNDATLRLFGCASSEEFCSKHPAGLSPPAQPGGMDSMALANTRIAEAMEKGSSFFEWLYKRADNGNVFPADVLLSRMELDGRTVLQATVRDITARKQVEQALQDSKERFRALVESTSDWIWEVDENAVYTYASPRVHDILGYEAQEVIGKTPFDFMPPEEAERVADTFRQMVAVKKPLVNLENINLHKDGRRIYLETSGVPVIDKEGNFLGYRGVDRDITGRKQAEDKLRKLSLAVEQSPASIVITDLDANIEYVNNAFARETGYAQAEVIGQNPRILNSGKNLKETYQEMWWQLKCGETWHGELINRRKNGSEYIESVLISPIRRNDGKVTHYLAIKENITERKNDEAKIKRLSRIYRLLGQVNEAIVLSSDRKELYENICKSAMDSGLFQFAWIGLVDKNKSRLEPVVCSETSNELISLLDIRLDDEKCRNWPVVTAIHDDVHIIKQDVGELPHVIPWRDKAAKLGLQSIGIFPFHEAGIVAGSINAYAADKHFFTPDIVQLMQELVADVSFALDVFAEKKRREEAEENAHRANAELEYRVQERTRELESVNRELEAFCYSVSHDLRAPLRSIDGFSQILLKKNHAQLDVTGKDYLERVCRASQRMGQLIDDLLQLSKVTRGSLKRKLADVSNIAKETADELHKAHPERKVCFKLQPGLTAYADEGLLRIVLDNLLGNAFKYTARKDAAEIEFGARDWDGEKAFFVCDNGAGFNMSYAHKLFNPFQRLHAANEFEGSGIGLATVQRIIHRHYGKVWAEGEEGKGAAFYFTLPQRENERQEKMP